MLPSRRSGGRAPGRGRPVRDPAGGPAGAPARGRAVRGAAGYGPAGSSPQAADRHGALDDDHTTTRGPGPPGGTGAIDKVFDGVFRPDGPENVDHTHPLISHL